MRICSSDSIAENHFVVSIPFISVKINGCPKDEQPFTFLKGNFIV
jgi:hypothetical protein